MRGVLLILLLLVGGLDRVFAAAPSDRHLRRARVAVTGPLDSLSIEASGAGRARLELDLAAGERRELVVGCIPSSLASEEAPRLVASGGGTASFVGWVEDDRAQEQELDSRLSLGLRARPIPPAPAANEPGTPLASMLIALGAFLVVLKLRTRPFHALGAGALGAVAVVALVAPVATDGASLRLIEIEGRSPWALEVLVARSRLSVPAGWHGRLATRPTQVPVDLALDGAGPQALWTLEAGAADLVRFAPLMLPALELELEGSNELVALAEVWLRSADGFWTRHGAWSLGEFLPEPLAGPGEPPGWLNPALPQGRTVLIARLEDPAALAGDGLAPTATWLRWIGF